MKKVTKLWTTKSGKKIRICDMTDDHLKNTVRMLHAKAERIKNNIPFPCFNGEMAQYYAEQDFDNLQEMSVDDFANGEFPLYYNLCEELDRRKLSI